VQQENDPQAEEKKPEIELDDLTPEKDAKGGGQGKGGPKFNDPPTQAE